MIGATGRQGGEVARRLLRKEVSVPALTRRPDSAVADELKRAVADIRTGDLDDRASVNSRGGPAHLGRRVEAAPRAVTRKCRA